MKTKSPHEAVIELHFSDEQIAGIESFFRNGGVDGLEAWTAGMQRQVRDAQEELRILQHRRAIDLKQQVARSMVAAESELAGSIAAVAAEAAGTITHAALKRYHENQKSIPAEKILGARKAPGCT